MRPTHRLGLATRGVVACLLLALVTIPASRGASPPRAYGARVARGRDGMARAPAPLPVTIPEQQLSLAIAATLRRNYVRPQLVVYPSPAYSSPYLRDSFWVAQTIDSLQNKTPSYAATGNTVWH